MTPELVSSVMGSSTRLGDDPEEAGSEDIAAASSDKQVCLKSNSPVPRLSFAHRFDTKLREMSFEKQNSAKAVLFTMYVSTAGAKTFYHRKT